MVQRINVAVIGATGMVGQNYIRLLANHPWFEVAYVAASPQSAGKPYAEAVAGRWHMPSDLPEPVRKLVVGDANDVEAARGKCALVFSAVSLEKQATAALECAYAAAGLPVVSNNSAHRFTPDVPMIIPEINPGHLDVIAAQRKARGWTTGCIVVKSNCSIQSYMTPVWALWQAGYKPRTLVVATLQALLTECGAAQRTRVAPGEAYLFIGVRGATPASARYSVWRLGFQKSSITTTKPAWR